MIEFLVQLSTSLPAEWPAEHRADLLSREAARGRELRDSRVIVALWRVPGQLANVGIWRVADPTALHDAISSLPAWPWMTVSITPLARHPLFADDTTH